MKQVERAYRYWLLEQCTFLILFLMYKVQMVVSLNQGLSCPLSPDMAFPALAVFLQLIHSSGVSPIGSS